MGRASNIAFGLILIAIGLSVLNYVTIPAIDTAVSDIDSEVLGFLYVYVLGWVGTILLGFLTTVGFISLFKSGEVSLDKK